MIGAQRARLALVCDLVRDWGMSVLQYAIHLRSTWNSQDAREFARRIHKIPAAIRKQNGLDE
jgi:hypothetical protein